MTSDMTCDRADELLPDWMDGTLAEPARARVAAHLDTCARCASLVSDLEMIRAEAKRLPALAPPRDLWAGIAGRIEAPVVALPVLPGERSRRPRPWWMTGVAAASLVLATAGVTWWMARARYEATGGPSIGRAVDSAAPVPLAAPAAATTTTTLAAVPAAPVDAASTTPERVAAGRSTVGRVARVGYQAAYDREIRSLREILESREHRLDPATVAVIERSLRVIDDAIVEARAAVERDPENAWLRGRLSRALDRKVHMLRTVATLPARS